MSDSDPQGTDSAQLKFLKEWITALERKDPDLTTKFLHKDFRCKSYPQSLGKAEKTRDEWAQQFKQAHVNSIETKVACIGYRSKPLAG